MERILFDIETDGLLPELTKVHSLVLIDLDTGDLVSCADQEGYRSVDEGIDILYGAKLLVGHNIQGFDLPALHKTHQFDTDAELHDTLIMSRLIWSDLKHNDFRYLEKNPEFPKQLIGSHSLKAWGYRLGNHKDEYDG